MVNILKNNLSKIQQQEENEIDTYGVSVSILNYDAKTLCNICTFDPYYKTSSNPDCPKCHGLGYLYITSIHKENVIIKYLIEEQQKDLSGGDLITGDCKLLAKLQSKPYFDNSVSFHIPINVDGQSMWPTGTAINILNTSIRVLMTRSDPSKGIPNG